MRSNVSVSLDVPDSAKIGSVSGRWQCLPTIARDALALSWDAIGFRHNHAGCVDNGRYVPADVYEDHQGRFTGVYLVLDQRGVGAERSEWHLHQDFVTTLGLTRERDTWVRPDEDYTEVARLIRASDGSATLLEARASHLRDYLCARDMGLVVSSYRDTL